MHRTIAPAHRGHVLVVEDDKSMRELLWLHLSEAGYAVTLAEDAIVGGQHILRSPPDLLLLDVDMPFMTGIELAACMTADSTVPHIPIVFFTGNEHFVDKAARFGAVVLLKPCTKTRLLETVAIHIGAKPGRGRGGCAHVFSAATLQRPAISS